MQSNRMCGVGQKRKYANKISSDYFNLMPTLSSRFEQTRNQSGLWKYWKMECQKIILADRILENI